MYGPSTQQSMQAVQSQSGSHQQNWSSAPPTSAPPYPMSDGPTTGFPQQAQQLQTTFNQGHQQSGLNMSSNPFSRVILNMACRNLRDCDVFSKSDPMVVVFIEVRSDTAKHWQEIGRTEVIQDNLNPDFTTPIIIDYRFEEYQKLKFEAYDCDSSNRDLSKHDFLGRMECTLGSIMGEGCGKYEKELVSQKGVKSGKILLTAEEMCMNNEILTLQFKGRKLDKKDFFGLSDPFLVFQKCNEDNSYTAVHKTEVIKNTLNPTWKQFDIPASILCNGDHDRIMKIQCFDWDSDGGHDFIGETSCNITDFKTNPSLSKELINPKKKTKKKSYKNSGFLDVLKFKIETKPSFLDFIQGGTELCFSVAIDFTASNGDPALPSSLHYTNPYEPNQYISALQAVGQICQDYDSDKVFPAFGFGAKVPPNFSVSHMFPLNGTQDPNCFGIDGIIQAYLATIRNVKLFGPTNFAPVINQTAMLAKQADKINPGKRYFVLLILTDGIISDMEQTKRAIVSASYLPLSIIIVGIGPAEFDAMDELDADEQLLMSGGISAERDIVQFVPFRKFCRQGNISGDALAREVLAELPEQVCGYMKKHGIKPEKPAH